MNDIQCPTSCTTIEERKSQQDLVLQLSGVSFGSEVETVSNYSPIRASTSSSGNGKVIIVNGKLVFDDKRRFKCTFPDCTKIYKKPSRLEEHERTHSGQRPFVCLVCNKSYFRDSHLQAHARSHLPEESRPFPCLFPNCSKRFWTAQHLKRHCDVHTGEKPFKCNESGCTREFSKHHQLRSHVSLIHCPPGTLPFRCSNMNCTRSFQTSQKLKSHMRTHEERRYICSHPECIKDQGEVFSNWSALQTHTRSVHPATCPYPSCKGKLFSQQKGLRAHIRIHEQREAEDTLLSKSHRLDDNEEEDYPVKRRRGGEVGRDWRCTESGCEKNFKSKKALAVHVKVSHLKRRDFICSYETCNVSFGYKHLLQRHISKVHYTPVEDNSTELTKTKFVPPEKNQGFNVHSPIDTLTGKAYAMQSELRIQSQDGLHCPYHILSSTNSSVRGVHAKQSRSECPFVFTRAYNLRRHLLAMHSLDIDKHQAIDIVAAMRQGNDLSTLY